MLGASSKTTNCLESVNALVEERCAKVNAWKASHQWQRWLAAALLDIEPRLRKVQGYQHPAKLQTAISQALSLTSEGRREKQAAASPSWSRRFPARNGIDSSSRF